jgi:hypothetical protein
MTPIAANKIAPRLLNRHLPSPPESSRHAQTTERRDYSGPQARPGRPAPALIAISPAPALIAISAAGRAASSHHFSPLFASSHHFWSL